MNLQKYLIIFFFLSLSHQILAAGNGKHALLIGITDYPTAPLKGAINDIELMQKILQERFNFQNHDFIILKNQQATRTGVKNAFLRLARRVKSGDFVYIHYSGHGSQTKDCNGDEQNGKDQTWVTYSSRTRKWLNAKHEDNYDVLDDEIHHWLQPIYAKTHQVIFVSDSCHSATVSRGGVPVSRAIDEDTRTHPLCHKKREPKEFIYKGFIERGLRIGAAQDNETTIEIPIEDQKFYGLFTWYWAKMLQAAKKEDTWHDIFRRTTYQISIWRDGIQHPKAQIEGSGNLFVLNNDFKPLPKTVTVERIIRIEGTVRINAGKTVGVTEGSIYRLYKPQYSNQQEWPYLTISHDIGEFLSIGKPVGVFKTDDLLIEESHVYPFKPIPVFLQSDSNLKERDKLLLKEIRRVFDEKRLPAYRLTYNSNEAQYFLRLQVHHSAELQVLTPEGQLLHDNLQISFNNLKQGIDKLQINLSKLARIRELKALQPHPPNKFPGKVQTWIFEPVSSCQRCRHCFTENNKHYCSEKNDELQNFQGKNFSMQDILAFSITNESEKDFCFYLLSISPDGAIDLLFPASKYEVQKKRACLNTKKTETHISRLLLDQKQEWTLKLIATLNPIDVSILTHNGFEQSRSIEMLNPLERLLNHAMTGQRGSGSIIKVGQSNRWATEEISFQVK